MTDIILCQYAASSKETKQEAARRMDKERICGNEIRGTVFNQPRGQPQVILLCFNMKTLLASFHLFLLPVVLAHQDHGKVEDGPTNYAQKHVCGTFDHL